MGQHWTLDDIAWRSFDAGRVDADVLLAVKAASMVESHSDDYVAYLRGVFHDDADFQREAERWGSEEQHGDHHLLLQTRLKYLHASPGLARRARHPLPRARILP